MFISVIICTYGRAAALKDLLASLNDQEYRHFEVLIVDGNEHPSSARDTLQAFLRLSHPDVRVHLIASTKGLTHQRNVGLQHAGGEIVCFLDDDVTLKKEFLSRVAGIFMQPEMQDVGGITGYDPLNYPAPITLRWRLRRTLGVIPNLEPGGVDRLGRGIPLSFLKPFKGYKEVGLLPGFCMIFRRRVLGNLRFDELIPTYGGEDRDFSMRVGWRSRMLICGDLPVNHHNAQQGRDSLLSRNFQSSFGAGRRFAKYARGARDYPTLVITFVGDLAIDVMFLIRRPSRTNLAAVFIRMRGFLAGLRSDVSSDGQVLPREIYLSERQRSDIGRSR